MENVISYYYNLIVDKSKLINNVLIIESDNNLFIAKSIHNIESFEEIITSMNSYYYFPILNKEGKYYFEYNNLMYALFKADGPSELIGENLLFLPIISNIKIDYSTIWENNIDYFIKKITEMDKDAIEEVNYINYYIGMSENAITINENAKRIPSTARFTISHFRINYPNYTLYYKDPTELLIDYISRDIAEYTKSKFFFAEMTVDELIGLINKYNLNDKEVMFMFARLMYPSYYFDAISGKNIDKQKIINKKRESYEKFLYNAMKQIKTSNLYLNIEWLSH